MVTMALQEDIQTIPEPGRMKPQLLDRTLIQGPHLMLVTSKKEFAQAMREFGVTPSYPWINSDADATVHTLESNRGLACIVSLNVPRETGGIVIAGLLTHEAVHIWQQYRRNIGERKPSPEFEAYAIQSISQTLMQAYAERISA
jgi:hypothetical protein